jgi:hypothetical protein
LIGSRGTGKTTLLKTLHWEERLRNPQLGEALGGLPFADHIIGLYEKLPETQFLAFQRASRSHPPEIFAEVFSLYLDLLWGQLLCEAIAQLGARGVVDYDLGEERVKVSEFIEDRPALTKSGRFDMTLLGLRRALHQSQLLLESLTERGASPDHILSGFGRGIGTFGRALAKTVVTNLIGGAWHVRVCFDEAEILDPNQIRTLNSIVRLSEQPLSYLVSLIRAPDDLTATFLGNLSLQEADRRLLIRDRLDDTDFRFFAQGISEVRARYAGENSPVRLTDILGELDLDKLAAWSLGKSDKESVVRFLEEAQGNVIDAYYQRRQGSMAPPASEPKRRRTAGAKRRKSTVSAYLQMHAEFGLRPRYASSDVVLHVSDGCIRDFLWQMDELCNVAGGLSQFLSSRGLDFERQDAAITAASQNKAERFEREIVVSPDRSRRFVSNLARLTYTLQSGNHAQVRGLDAEAGLFVIAMSRLENELSEMIRDATQAGFIAVQSSNEHRWTIRVHGSLAPSNSLSWRGGYRHITLQAEEIRQLANEGDGGRDAVLRRLGHLDDPTIQTLPFQEETD